VERPRKILLIRPSALGDVVRSVPVLVSIRKHFPEAQVDWLVQDTFTAGIEAHPDLNDVITFARRSYRGKTGWIKAIPWLRHLRRKQYDMVFDCQGLLRSALFSFVTGAPERVGFANAREGGSFAYTKSFHVDREMHTVDRMLELVRLSGIEPVTDMRLYLSEKGKSGWEKKRKNSGLAGQPYAVLAPTSRWVGKAWPVERFLKAADYLFSKGIPRVVIVGAESERMQCQPLINKAQDPQSGFVDMVGKTDIAELMAVIADSSFVLANDSAALHIAVGFDRPLVALFGPTDPAKVGPYHREETVVRPADVPPDITHKNEKAGSEIMQRITVEEVTKKIDEILSQE